MSLLVSPCPFPFAEHLIASRGKLPRSTFRSRRTKTCAGIALLGLLTVFHAPLRAAIALSAVAPLGASRA